jgi:hypothetical protein
MEPQRGSRHTRFVAIIHAVCAGVQVGVGAGQKRWNREPRSGSHEVSRPAPHGASRAIHAEQSQVSPPHPHVHSARSGCCSGSLHAWLLGLLNSWAAPSRPPTQSSNPPTQSAIRAPTQLCPDTRPHGPDQSGTVARQRVPPPLLHPGNMLTCTCPVTCRQRHGAYGWCWQRFEARLGDV